MKKKRLIVLSGIIFVAFFIFFVVALASSDDLDLGVPSADLKYPYSRGMLTTGIKYEFHGEFDFYAFRHRYGFYWEMDAKGTISATTPLEAAEYLQFYISPTLKDLQQKREHIEGESAFIAVRYCPTMDIWVAQYVVPKNMRLYMLGEPPIFAANRTTGDVRAFSRNMGSSSIIEGDEGGWHRTIGKSRRTLQSLINSLM